MERLLLAHPPTLGPAPKHHQRFRARDVRSRLWIQSVDATIWLNISAGVLKSKVFRGRSLRLLATVLSCACEYPDISTPFGRYCRNRPLVFSLVPRCHGFCGSQK